MKEKVLKFLVFVLITPLFFFSFLQVSSRVVSGGIDRVKAVFKIWKNILLNGVYKPEFKLNLK